MIEGSSILKMRVLICLDEMEPKGRNVTHLASLFGVAKSTISRIMEWCIKNNMVMKQDRLLTITSYGRKIAYEFNEKRKVFLNWLLSEGVPLSDAEQDASQFALYCSNKAQHVIRSLSNASQISDFFRGRSWIPGNEVCSALPNGRYSISCMLLHADKYYGYCPSDCSNWFNQAGEMTVHHGSGLILLRNHAQMQLRNYSLFYLSNHTFKQAGRENGSFFFPMDDLYFMNIDGKHLLQGWTKLRLSETTTANPKEQEEIFTMFF